MTSVAVERNHPTRQKGDRAKDNKGPKSGPPPFIQKVGLAAHIIGLQSYLAPSIWIRDWREWFYPPDGGPNIVKAYECRPNMPVRIFFPSSYDQTSPQSLPTVITIHGGGFCIGTARELDEYNRAFADANSVLIVSLGYRKAPRNPFPTALHDLEALYLAVVGDESLPIDRQRHGQQAQGCIAVLGFSAGGNLALALCQLPNVKQHRKCPPSAVVSVYGCLDVSRDPELKKKNRPYKETLSAPRGDHTDVLASVYNTFMWSYLPYGQDLRDPLLSPIFAKREDLPANVCFIAAELDMMSHESWQMASRLAQEGAIARGDGKNARRRIPDPDAAERTERICGREQPGAKKGALEDLGDERFGFEVSWKEGDGDNGSVKWLLVPDQIHGFDNVHMRQVMMGGGEESMRDAELKTVAYVKAVGEWLRGTVWKM